MNAGRPGDDDRHAVLFVFFTRAIVVDLGFGTGKRNAEEQCNEQRGARERSSCQWNVKTGSDNKIVE